MSAFIERMGWVLIHSLWQFALLAAVAFVLQWAMRRVSAAARYIALLTMLGIVVAAPFVTWGFLPAEAPQPVIAADPTPVLPKPVVLPNAALTPVAIEVVPLPAVAPPAPIVPVVVSPPVAIAPLPELPHPTWSERVQGGVTPWLSTIVWGWSLGVLAFTLRPLLSWFTVHRLRTRGVSPVPEAVQAALTATAQRLGITQTVRILQSAALQVPIVTGYLKPVILLPVSIVTGMPASQLDAILAHELAHIRRHDYLVNLVQTLVETVFFYHPGVWWLSHQIRCERENCCDDIAVSLLGSRLDYSRALLALEELRATSTPLAIGASGGSLVSRVRRLFGRDPAPERVSHGSLALGVLLVVGVLALVAIAETSDIVADEGTIPGSHIEIPGHGEIEIVGLGDSSTQWWSPKGVSLAGTLDPGMTSDYYDFTPDFSHGHKLGVLARFRGRKTLSQVGMTFNAHREAHVRGFSQWSSQTERPTASDHETDIHLVSTNVDPQATTGDCIVRLSFEPWRAWQTIDLVDPKQSQNIGPLELFVGRTPSSLASSECEIGLQFLDGLHREIRFEQVALDAAGQEIQVSGFAGTCKLGCREYQVPKSQVAKIKYRIQWYTHEVTFRHLALQAGHKTEPRVRVKVLHVPEKPADFSGPVASPESWPQLGGSAGHNPVSTVTNLPTQFDLTKKENIRWSQPIGNSAFSSPVVAGGKVLIGTNNAIGRDPRFPKTDDVACLQCFDEATGAFLWQYSSPRMQEGRQNDWPLLRTCLVPVVEGDRVWVVTNRCEVVCLDLNGHRDNEDDGLPEPEASAPGAESADVVWRYDLFSTLGVRPQKAACVTPTIAGNLLLLNSPNDVDESPQKLATSGIPAFLAFDKTSGQLVWSDKTPNTNIHCNGCSMGVPVAPAAALIDGSWQAIFAGYDGWLYAFDLEAVQRGETQLLWKFDLNPKIAKLWRDRGIANTPVVDGHRVYAAVGNNTDDAGDQGRLWCIDGTKRGDLSSELVYNKSAPDVVIPHKQFAVEPDKGDFTRPNPNSGVVWVYTSDDLNQNGKIEYDERMHHSNSLPAIHDGLLMTTDLNGICHCLDAATGKLLWSHDLLGASDSGPLIADGKAWVIDDDGDLLIFALSREKQLLAEHHLDSLGYTNLAAANETLYVATKTQLVAIGSGDFPQPGRVSAKLPSGLEIELVGVTPNSAPTSEGWCPDGSPIEGAGDWPRGSTFSKDGDRFTMTTDTATKLTPDPLARDVLFECRGAASRPSWTVLRQSGLAEFQTLGTDAGLRKRLTLLRKDQAAQTTVEMAYTDSPWGPWQRIDASGKRINTIETFAPDQKLYGEIRIDRLGPSAHQDDKGSPLKLVLSEPATSDDYQSGVFDISVRFVDKNQRDWATYAQPQPMQAGRRTVTWRTAEAVSLESLAYAEFRLRPYRHFISFENVPLEKSAAGAVAVKHRSIPAPPRRTPDDRFVAHLPDGVDIELLRIVRNDLPENQSWSPDGTPASGIINWLKRSHFQVRPDGNGHTSSDERPGSDRVWDFLYEVRCDGVKPFVSVGIVGEGSVSSSQTLPAIGPRLVTILPKAPESFSALQLRVGTEPWGQWIQVGADGKILNPTALSDRPDSPEQLVTVAGAGIDGDNLDRCWIEWLVPTNAEQFYQMEVRGVDDEGKHIESRSSTTSITRKAWWDETKYFDVPLEELARFEYRLRPYRHLVTFDHICTDPAKPTEVQVRVEPIVFPQAISEDNPPVAPVRPLVAKLPGGLEVELVGVTKNFAPTKDGWKPDGSPIGEVPDWPSRIIVKRGSVKTSDTDDGTSDPAARDLLVEMRGLQSQPEITLLDIEATKGWSQIPHADPYRNRLSLLLNKPSDTLTFRMAISDAPWGPWQQVTLQGMVIQDLELAEPELGHYGQIRVVRCGPHPDDPGQFELTLEMPEKHQERYSFSIHAIDTEGKEMHALSSIEYDNSGKATATYRTDSGLPGKIARWEYRLRPYRHFITFENVSFVPGKKTEPKVSVESVAAAEPPKKFIAQVPGGIEVELLGTIRELKNLDRLSLAPDGSPLPSLMPYLQGSGDAFTNMKLGLKEFEDQILYQVRGGDSPTVDVRGPTRFGLHASERGAAQVPILYLIGHAPLPQAPMTFTAKVADEPWGEWIQVGPTGLILNPEATQQRHATCYDKITIGHAGEHKENTTRSELKLIFPKGFFDSCRLHLRIVPKEGQKLGDEHSMHFQPDSFTQSFKLPPDQVERFEFRLRPYRHLVKFENVSLDPEKPTEPKVSVETIAMAEPMPVTAQLPGGMELELLGVTPFRGAGQDGWTPQGLKFEKAPDWAGGLKLEPLPPGEMGDAANEAYRDFIVRARGFTPEQLALLPFSQKVEAGDNTIGRMQVLTWNQQVQRLRIGISGEWGPYRVLTVDPKVPPKAKAVEAPAEVPVSFRKVYDSIQPVIEAGQKLNVWLPRLGGDNGDNEEDDLREGRYTRVKWNGQPANPDHKYTLIEAVLVDLKGKRHTTAGTTNVQDGPSQWDVDLFRVPFDQVSHVEYRLRPYQHVVTFNNVALHVGAKCGPNVVVESPLAQQPPPPLEFRLVAGAMVKEPVEFAGQKWFPITGKAALDSARKPAVDSKSALGLPVERLSESQEHLGLVGDTPATSMPWDGTWHVEKCEIQPDPNGGDRFTILVTLDAQGGKALRTLTTDALRQRMAVLVEDRILVAPTVMEAIGTMFVITGNFTKEQAESLAKSIRRGMTQATNAKVTPPKPVTVVGFGRSAVGLMQGEKLLVAFFGRGKIEFDPQQVTTTFDDNGLWQVTFQHTTEEPKTFDYRVEYRSQHPNEVRINGRSIPLGLDTKWAEGTSKTHGIWCGLTSYGRAQPTERWHEWLADLSDPAKSEMNPERQFSCAWSLDNDLYDFESYRSTLEMDELPNVVLALDSQHPIQHSDGARAAILRVLADGRVFASGDGREAPSQLQLSPTELQSLLTKLIPMMGQPGREQRVGETLSPEHLTHMTSAWDAEQQFVTAIHGGKTYRLGCRYPSGNDPLGEEPLHWKEVLSQLGRLETQARAGGQANIDRCAEFATAELLKRHPESKLRFVADHLSWVGFNREGARVMNFDVVGETVSPRFTPTAEIKVSLKSDLAPQLLSGYCSLGPEQQEFDRWGPEEEREQQRRAFEGQFVGIQVNQMRASVDHTLSEGAGVFTSDSGEILTTYDVVKLAWTLDREPNPPTIQVRLDNLVAYQATLEEIDPERNLALLRVNPGWPNHAAKRGSSATVKAQDQVSVRWCRENPIHSMTGSVVTLDQSVSVDAQTKYEHLMALDAELPREANGGAVLNEKLELIGLTVLVPEGEKFRSYAIPIDTTREFIEQARQRHANKPWRAKGRVIGADGKPIMGVKVRAATGIGTLLGGGSGFSDNEGRCDFRFGAGTYSVPTKEDPDPNNWQLAIISAHLDGHVEKNHNQHGDGYASRIETYDGRPRPSRVCITKVGHSQKFTTAEWASIIVRDS